MKSGELLRAIAFAAQSATESHPKPNGVPMGTDALAYQRYRARSALASLHGALTWWAKRADRPDPDLAAALNAVTELLELNDDDKAD